MDASKVIVLVRGGWIQGKPAQTLDKEQTVAHLTMFAQDIDYSEPSLETVKV